MKIGIIGGKGRMGSWFADFFRKNKFEVFISDVGTKLTNQELVNKSDAVLFSVPISITAEVIESVIPFSRKGQILMDLTSVKTLAVDAMMKSDCEVLGMHPMFGPFLNSMNGQTIVVCKARPRKYTKVFTDLFNRSGAVIKLATAEEHDKIVAIVQSMTHFSAIASAHTIMDLRNDVMDTLGYTSPVYRINLEMIGRIMAQDPRLYAEIEIFNPYTKEVLKGFVRSAQDLLSIVEKKDVENFVDYFERSSEHMGRFRKISLDNTNKIIGGK